MSIPEKASEFIQRILEKGMHVPDHEFACRALRDLGSYLENLERLAEERQ